ncbi:MAG: hypothetical protein PHP41_02940 [Bacilli bacterium]|jgi:hypothetical protein|nr:hypothetical protein [Bacilli bacterium]MDY0064021.1 hypothetical protein [Bacilli bacterium]
MNLWKLGKIEIQKYYDLNLKKSTDLKAYILGILLTILVVLPILLVLIQFFKVYYYQPIIRLILSALGWFLLLLCNGLSNLFMVKLAKIYFPENPILMGLNEKAIFVRHTFSIGFALLTIAAILFFGVI